VLRTRAAVVVGGGRCPATYMQLVNSASARKCRAAALSSIIVNRKSFPDPLNDHD
jgi:hypothetical protein